jgi:8-oxo-dGTP pyrophosphatase MutT (NUDIX family)
VSPSIEPVRVRQAATVVLLRDSEQGLQTWLLNRLPQLAFAAGMSVFPGGAVDPDDAVLSADLALDPMAAATLASVASQLHATSFDAGRLMTAAIRETFEEVGVLLSQPPIEVDPASRTDVETHGYGFGQLLIDLGVRLDLAAIRPWSRWITPEGESRRYDTYFFVALLPEDATVAGVSSEASDAAWIGIDQALAEFRAGQRPMLPPTIATLTEVGGYASAAEVLAAAAGRDIAPIEPVLRRAEDGRLSADLGNGTIIELPAGFVRASRSTS